MHKSIPIAVIALFLIASPSIMFGTSNSNLFSKAMATEDRSDTGTIIKTNQLKDTGTSDGDRDKTSFIKTNDKTSSINTNQLKDTGTSDGDKNKTSSIKTNELKDKSKSSDDGDKSKSSDDGDKSKTSSINTNELKD